MADLDTILAASKKINGTTAKDPVVAADSVPIWDSVAGSTKYADFGVAKLVSVRS